MANPSNAHTIEAFEQKVVLRGARVLPLVLGALATLIVALAALGLLYSLTPTAEPLRPASIPEPAPLTLSLAEVQAFRTSEQPAATSPTQGPAAVNGPAAPDPYTETLAAVRAAAEEKGLAWTDQWTTVCSEYYYGYCISRDRVRSRRGISERIFEVLALYGGAGDEVPFSRSAVDADTRIAVLKELAAVLNQTPAAEASATLNAWAQLRTEREGLRRATWQARQDSVTREFQARYDDYQQTAARKAELKSGSLLAVGWALAAFVGVGIVLAVLAIERHTRALQEALRQTLPRRDAVSVPAVFGAPE